MIAPRSHRSRLLATAVGVLLVASLGACSASGSDADTTTTSGKAGTTTPSDESTTTTADDTTTTTDEVTTTTDDGETTTTTGGGGTERSDYIDAIVENLGGGGFATDEQAACLASEWIDELGLENLQDADISAEDFGDGDGDSLKALKLDDSDASRLFDAYATCKFDLPEIFAGFASGGKVITATQKACVDRLLTDDALRESFTADFFDRELDPDPVDEVDTCFE